MKDKIVIKGARVNNLKNVDLEIPRDKFIVFTGLSGSGKTSLAFDTLYAEGQRRYVESLSSYARQFLGQMDKPDVDYIEGLSPAISIDQKTTSRNPRSTVGTVTEVYDYMRLLYARVGTPHCPKCGKEIKTQTTDQILDSILLLEEGTKIQVMAPVVRGRKGEHEKVIANIKKSGYVRIRVDGVIYDMSEEEFTIEKTKKHNIEAVVDRLIIKSDIRGRLNDSVETALKMGEGLVIINVDLKEDILYSEHFACHDCGINLGEIEPRLFSFNAPYGKCDTCDGIGNLMEIDEEIVIPDKNLSILEGAVISFGDGSLKEGAWTRSVLEALAKELNFSLNTKVKDLPEEIYQILLNGYPKKKLKVKFTSESHSGEFNHNYEGILNSLGRRFRESNSDYIKNELSGYMSNKPCPKCHGNRLNDNALSVTIGGKNIAQVCSLSIKDELEFFKNLEFSEKNKMISEQILTEIQNRLTFLVNVGLDYLNLSRTAGTLSGGEAQRIRLATQIGSSLVGVLYILDEPSIGLHQRDNDRLIETLKKLRDIGNTLIVVEHDEDTMRHSDYIVDVGIGAGESGGNIVAKGTIEDIMNTKESLTGAYLRGDKKIDVPKTRRKAENFIEIIGAKENNLKNVNVKIPTKVFTAVTGVSGSGKSSLINEILYKGMNKIINRSKNIPGDFKEIKNSELFDKIIDIDQSPIGRTPRSNPATYSGVFDIIRELYSNTNDSKARGYKPGRFSFNVKGGRCEACKGDGIIKIEMQFLSDVYVPCEVCKGKRYNRETLEVRYKGKNIGDILNMPVTEAAEFFENIPRIKKKLDTLIEVGLGYIRLGQPSTQLSGGEAQRVKLAYELSKRDTGKTLYILDEPTTGLHIDDVSKLIKIIDKLTNGENTVVVIEHNLDVIKCADHIIDMGPEGGDKGGMIIAEGTPEEVAKNKESYTGMYLSKML